MSVPSLRWFDQLQEELNRDVDYLSLARWLMGPVLLRMGEQAFTLYFHKGRLIEVEEGASLTGFEFAIVGPEEDWARLRRGEIDLGRALTPPAGRLRLEGNVIKAAGNMRPLFHLCRKMSGIVDSEVAYSQPEEGSQESTTRNSSTVSPDAIRPHESDFAKVLSGISSSGASTSENQPSVGADARRGREIVGRYVDVGGVKTYYESAGEGDGILCIHTAGHNSRQWHAYLEHFSDRYRVVALDMPGHQKSWPMPGNRCIDDRDEFAGFLWAFQEAIGLKHPIVMGCSVGGNIVLLLAQQRPDWVKAVVSFEGADFTPPAAPSVLLNHPQISLPDYLYDRNTGLIGRRTPPDVRDFILWNVRQMTPEAEQSDLAVYANFDVRAGMDKITCPCLLVRGTDDWIVPQEKVEATASRLTRARFVEVANIEGAGHYSHFELPSECCAIIDGFLEKVELGSDG